MGSKIMLAMGYVPGTGLGAAADGRLQPVEAHAGSGKSLDECMVMSEKLAGRDPLKVCVELFFSLVNKKEIRFVSGIISIGMRHARRHHLYECELIEFIN